MKVKTTLLFFTAAFLMVSFRRDFYQDRFWMDDAIWSLVWLFVERKEVPRVKIARRASPSAAGSRTIRCTESHPLDQVRKRNCCAIFPKNASLYQDRLGTNIGKTQKRASRTNWPTPCSVMIPQRPSPQPAGRDAALIHVVIDQ